MALCVSVRVKVGGKRCACVCVFRVRLCGVCLGLSLTRSVAYLAGLKNEKGGGAGLGTEGTRLLGGFFERGGRSGLPVDECRVATLSSF